MTRPLNISVHECAIMTDLKQKAAKRMFGKAHEAKWKSKIGPCLNTGYTDAVRRGIECFVDYGTMAIYKTIRFKSTINCKQSRV